MSYKCWNCGVIVKPLVAVTEKTNRNGTVTTRTRSKTWGRHHKALCKDCYFFPKNRGFYKKLEQLRTPYVTHYKRTDTRSFG